MPEGENQNNDNQGGQGETPLTFDTWFGSQDEPTKELIQGHITGLKSALDSEREARKNFETQLRDAAKKAEKGSEAQTALNEMAERVSSYEKQARFYEVASAAGIGNLRLAWIAAMEGKLIDGQGNVNVETMKAQFPELFKSPPPPRGNAGNGAGQQGTSQPSMNDFIRRSAGVA